MARRIDLREAPARPVAVQPPAAYQPPPRRFGAVSVETHRAHLATTGEFLQVLVDGVDVTSCCWHADDVLQQTVLHTQTRAGLGHAALVSRWMQAGRAAYVPGAVAQVVVHGGLEIRPVLAEGVESAARRLRAAGAAVENLGEPALEELLGVVRAAVARFPRLRSILEAGGQAAPSPEGPSLGTEVGPGLGDE